MEPWLIQLRKTLLGDHVPRLLLVGGAVLLVLIVIIDAFGARDRAVAAREAARLAPPAEETSTATVPSVYRVPRDLASEAAAARAAQQAAEVAENAVAEDVATEIAEVEAAEDAPQDVAEDTATEDAAEPELAEAEAAEGAPQDVAEDTATEDAAEPELAEAEAAEDAPQDVAEDTATEDAAEPELAEAEAAEDAAQDVIADAAAGDGAIAILANADLANGQRLWRQCGACHVYESEQNRGGPHLVNIIGRDVAAAEGWRYSRALSEHGGVWSVESLLAWLENPDSYIPGNQMAFRGLRDEQDRIDVLGFLNDNRAD